MNPCGELINPTIYGACAFDEIVARYGLPCYIHYNSFLMGYQADPTHTYDVFLFGVVP